MVLDSAVQTCSRRRFVRQFAPVFGAPLLASCGLIDVSETSTSRKLKVSQNFPSCSIARVGFVKPVVSLSMGISEFEDAAWRSTPAHGLGANMMYELLRPKGDACLDITGRLGRCDALADTTIRLKPGTSEAESARYMLKLTTEVGYGFRIQDSPSLIKPGPDGRWLYFGDGQAMTRQRLLGRVRGIVDRARDVADATGGVLLVIYVCSHGIIDAEGRPRLIPSDATATDPRSWIGFDEILAPVFDLVGRGPNPDQARQAIVFFDCCQRVDAAAPSSVRLSDTLPEPPPGVALVAAVSPGQWAWHFASKMKVVGEVDASKRGLLGIPLPAAEKTGHIDEAYAGFMSVFPLATRCAMNSAARAFDAQFGSDPTVSQADMTVEEWISEIQQLVAELLEDDPVRRRAGGRQDVQLKVGQPFGPPVLRVVRKA